MSMTITESDKQFDNGYIDSLIHLNQLSVFEECREYYNKLLDAFIKHYGDIATDMRFSISYLAYNEGRAASYSDAYAEAI